MSHSFHCFDDFTILYFSFLFLRLLDSWVQFGLRCQPSSLHSVVVGDVPDVFVRFADCPSRLEERAFLVVSGDVRAIFLKKFKEEDETCNDAYCEE